MAAATLIENVCHDLAMELAQEFGLRSEWFPPSGPNGEDDGLWLPGTDDAAKALTYAIPPAAILKALCHHLGVPMPAVVARAFELGAEDLLWVAEGREAGEARRTE